MREFSPPVRKLEGKVSVITGAAKGLGAAFAERFAQDGASLVLADIDDETGRELATTLGRGKVATGADCIYVHADVTRPEDVEAMVASAVDRFGRLDVLVNNAGINPVGNVVETSVETWDTQMAVNLRGVFLGCKFGVQAMLRSGKGGAIINIGSVSGLEAGPVSQAAYETSKAGVIALTKSVAQDFAGKGIRANCICPGATATPLLEQFMASMDPGQKESFLRIIPMGRPAKPTEIASVAAFLASDESSYVTGATVVADGGRTVGILRQT